MLIDECASGGRRNDLEMMRRSVPLWRSDRLYMPSGQQCLTYGISLWMPYYGNSVIGCARPASVNSGKLPVESYAFWSTTAPSTLLNFDVRVKDLDYDAIRRLIGQWREINYCYAGDFYPLTKSTLDANAWLAWQYDCPDRESGVVQVFRREQSPEDTITLKLRGLDPKARYRITRFDSAEETTKTGEELQQFGLIIRLPEKPAAAVLKYRSEQ
jgi:alpha-galactosidase